MNDKFIYKNTNNGKKRYEEVNMDILEHIEPELPDKDEKVIWVGFEGFEHRFDESGLPNVGAFCKRCAKETAKPFAAIYMNDRPAYALRCIKCGSEYPMYKSMFIQRYVGYDTKNGGHVNPTHGTKSLVSSMDRKAKENHKSRRAQIEKYTQEQICSILGCSKEEYEESKKRREEQKKKYSRMLEKDEFLDKYEEKERMKESNKRKELIAKGIIKYVKNVGLVNTETGEIIKL